MRPVDAYGRFSELARRSAGDFPLDEAVLLIAAYADPALDVAAELDRLDELASGCDPTLEGWRRHLFVDLGFAGNAVDYYDPRNSFLHEVMRRRTGIPVSLSVIGMEVGRRLGVRLAGVGMPGHFLLRVEDDPSAFVDPFFGGRLLDADGCEQRFHELHGRGAPFDPSYLEPVAPKVIVVRMLANLEAIYTQRGDQPSLGWVKRLRLALATESDADRRRLSALLAGVGRFGEAAVHLEALADEVPEGAERLQAEARALRARLN